jgi:DNA repair protein SbcC/Rad50
MRPLRLMLEGFASYREPTDIDFNDVNFFALVGPTGSGKSTVIDGLCFALYGTVPRWGKENVVKYALAASCSKSVVRATPQRGCSLATAKAWCIRRKPG